MSPVELAFHTARSEVLDAFADLETSAISLLTQFGGEVGCPTRPLSQKLDSLAALKPAPRLSKKRKTDIAEATVEIRRILAVRADIVHSRAKILAGPEPSAIYMNTASAIDAYPTARVMTLKHLNELSRQVETLARRLISAV